jgi:hypothetical protein
MRAFWLGLVSATALFLVLAVIAAQLSESATETVAAANRLWLVSCALAGVVAGFTGARIARSAPAVAARYAAAVTGPALLALVFALTTTAEDRAGVWAALAITAATAALGAYARERIAAAQRRR